MLVHQLGLRILPERLNIEKHFFILQHVFPDLLQGMKRVARRRVMWFLRDGAPAHYSIAVRSRTVPIYGYMPRKSCWLASTLAGPHSHEIIVLEQTEIGCLSDYQTPEVTLEDLVIALQMSPAHH